MQFPGGLETEFYAVHAFFAPDAPASRMKSEEEDERAEDSFEPAALLPGQAISALPRSVAPSAGLSLQRAAKACGSGHPKGFPA